ncbi:NAD kinase [Bifidobacterium avesanii]|uniref:NAD kinase n=1 Tax=Bifidobacterium avesanii TaxID=1798157 RepID=A0A7K3TEM9_9BIFI|nr:NAD(+) kinase [Bifidobacterium avesanii]NEG77547.1 NAD kinase [Bifidobacterium avesanii]
MSTRHAVVVTHQRLRSSGNVVAEVVEQLRHVGFDVTIVDNLEAPEFGVQPPVVKENTEIVVVLGGDGTILRAAELVHCTQVPIIGINMGHVGFLAEFESFQLSDAIRRVAEHDYSVDERMIAHVDVTLPGADKPLQDWALNDITVERADRGKMVELGIQVDGVDMSSFGCDGVIVSTPTGSTAYAFSAGGPIIWPNVQALQLVPIAAHALFARPLVIGAGSTFTMEVLDNSMSEGWICCDGRRQRVLPKGTRIDVRQSRDTLRLARLSGVPFTNRLVTKFDLPVVGWREHAQQQAQAQLAAGDAAAEGSAGEGR